MFDEKKVIFWPVGTGDSTSVVVKEGVVLQVDIRDLKCAEEVDDDHAAIVDTLVDELPQKNGRPYLAVFALTHPDKDHILGFSDLLDRVDIGELWFTPRIFMELEEELCDDAISFKEEAERRVAITIDKVGKVKSGDRIRLIGYDSLLQDDPYEGFPNELLTVPGNSITELDGEDYSDDFNAFIHAPFVMEDEGDRNNTSLCMQISFGGAPGSGGVLLFGDIAYPRIRRIFDATKEAGNEEYLAWKVFLAPHHCSKKAMYQKEDDREILKQDILDDLSDFQIGNGVIVASCEEIPKRNKKGDNPPHAIARNRYEEIALGGFLCTHEDGGDGEPIVFIVKDGVMNVDDMAGLAATPSVGRSLSAAIDDARGSEVPPAEKVGYGG